MTATRRAVAVVVAGGAVLLAVATATLAPTTTTAATAKAPKPAQFEIEHAPINELSGLAASSLYPGVLWAHNDSGDSSRLFAVQSDGQVIMPPWKATQFTVNGSSLLKAPWPGITIHNAVHLDWETVAAADGYLYVGDVGNNGNARRDLGIYVIPEPNPWAIDAVRAERYLPVRYPEQTAWPARNWHFDCEAMFAADGALFLLTKHRKAGHLAVWEPGTQLYRLDLDAPETVERVGVNQQVSVVTGAALSPDGNILAVLTYTRVWLFDRPEQGHDWLNTGGRYLDIPFGPQIQAEAIAFEDPETLLVAGETSDVYRVKLASVITTESGVPEP